MKLSEEAISQLVNDLEKAKSYEDLMGKDGAIKKILSYSHAMIFTILSIGNIKLFNF